MDEEDNNCSFSFSTSFLKNLSTIHKQGGWDDKKPSERIPYISQWGIHQ